MNTSPLADVSPGIITAVLSDDPLVAKTYLSDAQPHPLLVIHSGCDQIHFHGLTAEHARLIARAVNAPFNKE